jgi:hypothetical protein
LEFSPGMAFGVCIPTVLIQAERLDSHSLANIALSYEVPQPFKY